ncbi:MAG: hypothetical protein ABI867_44145 [Kofleriaceae bacterium]
MKRVLAVLVVASAAHAAPAPHATSWADWVGTFEGTLAWRSCTTPGAKQVALAIDATDGVLAIDLAPASPGLRTLSLVSEAAGWSAQQGDVEVRITRPKAELVDLVIELDSGCMARGQLRRAATGVPACDQLTAWAKVEAHCSKLRDAPLEDAAKLVATKWRAADAGGCTKRAQKLELALIDVGCAPHPDPQIGTRARECLDLGAASAKLARCGGVPQQIKDLVAAQAQQFTAAAQTAERATLPYVEQQCRDVKATIASIATQFGC